MIIAQCRIPIPLIWLLRQAHFPRVISDICFNVCCVCLNATSSPQEFCYERISNMMDSTAENNRKLKVTTLRGGVVARDVL